MKDIQSKKLHKRANNKGSFNTFVNSDYTNFEAFRKACKNDENLAIYTCLKHDELLPYIEKIKEIDDIKEKIKYLKNHQPAMNETEERFDVCIKSIAGFLKNYINYNGFIMNNSDGDAEDWASEFWLKYVKVCDFYRERWFHPENLVKESTVTYNTMKYKEFVYICRMSITGERRHQAFLATQKPSSSIFKPSLDFKLDSKSTNEKSLIDVLNAKDPSCDSELMLSKTNVNNIIDRALQLSENYQNGKYTAQIAKYYEYQDSTGINKKIQTLGKIFLYKAGLVSPKSVSFIKSLSNKYKSKFNISNALLIRQSNSLKKNNSVKVTNYNDILEDGGNTRVGLLLRKRGTLD